MTDAAAQRAMLCGATHGLTVRRPYAPLRLYLVDSLPGNRADYGIGGRAFVLRWLKDEPKVWAHLFLHQIFGLPGAALDDHPPVFAACGLAAGAL